MILETYETLLAAYAADQGCTGIKGFPTWGRGAAQTPCVAFELVKFEPEPARIGQLLARGATGYRGWLFARSEPELCTMLDKLIAYHKTHGAFEIATQRVVCTLQAVERHEAGLGPEQEQHAVTFLIRASW